MDSLKGVVIIHFLYKICYGSLGGSSNYSFFYSGYAMDPSEGNSIVAEPVMVGDESANDEYKGKYIVDGLLSP